MPYIQTARMTNGFVYYFSEHETYNPDCRARTRPSVCFRHQCLSQVDAHDHSFGNGVQITPAGLNINSSLPFGNQLATNLQGVSFFLQANALTITSTLYVKNGTEGSPLPDLWYYDGANQVQITSGGNVNATAASIPGESYAGGTFTWVQGAGSTTPANFAIASVTLSPATAGGGTIGPTLGPNAGIASAYNLQLPLPTTTPSFLSVDGSGNILNYAAVSGGLTGANLAAGTITASNIAALTITATQIANQTITATQIANKTITTEQIAENIAYSGNNNAVANSTSFVLAGSAAITTSGNSVDLIFAPVQGSIGTNSGFVLNGSAPFMEVLITMNGGGIASTVTGSNFTGIFAYAPGIVNFTDLSAIGVSGARVYDLYIRFSSGSGTITVANSVLIVREN